MLLWLRRRRERDDQSPVKGVAPLLDIDPIEELRSIMGEQREGSSDVRNLPMLTSYATKAETYACNNRHYVNPSGRVVHSLLAGLETLIGKHSTATVAFRFRSTDPGHARIIMAWRIGNDAPHSKISRSLLWTV